MTVAVQVGHRPAPDRGPSVYTTAMPPGEPGGTGEAAGQRRESALTLTLSQREREKG